VLLIHLKQTMLSFLCVCTLGLVVFAATFMKVFMKVTTGMCKSTRRMEGKTVVITGANTGIGKTTALDLAKRGARVVLVCRDLVKAAAAKKEIEEASGSEEVVVMECDLSSMASVRRFCIEFKEKEPRLDVLINNAGLGITNGMELTEEGLEKQMATNHFGPFLLTHLLIDKLKDSGCGRIVNVSSAVHHFASGLDVDNLNSEKKYEGRKVYRYSKLANILFTKELAVRLEQAGVTCNCLHPGIVQTEIFRHLKGISKNIFMIFYHLYFKTAEEGAQTTIHLAVSEDVENVTGKYFSDCKIATESKPAQSMELARKLWEKSEQIVRLTPNERIPVP